MVKRYDMGREWCRGGSVETMVEDPTGYYVLHEDYRELLVLAQILGHLVKNNDNSELTKKALDKLEGLVK